MTFQSLAKAIRPRSEQKRATEHFTDCHDCLRCRVRRLCPRKHLHDSKSWSTKSKSGAEELRHLACRRSSAIGHVREPRVLSKEKTKTRTTHLLKFYDVIRPTHSHPKRGFPQKGIGKNINT